MVVGRPLDCAEPIYDKEMDLLATIKNAVKGYTFPILFNVDLGHADPKVTLPVGVRASLVLPQEGRPEFTLLESGVE
jgi:muramoyltetrapeptide carboxypeptidase